MKKFVLVLTGICLALSLMVFAACDEEKKSDNTVSVTSVSLNDDLAGLKVSEEVTLTATVLPENASDKTVTWTSADTKIATVEDGKVTGVSEGVTTVTAKAGDKTVTCKIVVADEKVNTADAIVTAAAQAEEGDIIFVENGTYDLASQVRFNNAKNVTLIGDNAVLTATKNFPKGDGSKGYSSIITLVNCENITISGITAKEGKTFEEDGFTDYAHGVNIVESTNVVLENVTAEGNDGCGIVVNHSSVTLKNVKTNTNGWGGVNIDSKNIDDDKTSLTVDSACAFSEALQIYTESTAGVTVNAEGYTSMTQNEYTFWTKTVA